MISVRGVYDGKKIKALETFNVPPNVEVIITFLDKEIGTGSHGTDNKTKEFLELAGSWEDERSAEEIIKEIYDSRTSSRKDISL